MEPATTIDLTTATSHYTDENVSKVVRMLMTYKDIKNVGDLADEMGFKRGTMYNRINYGKPWLAFEIAQLAEFFDLEPGDFFLPANEAVAKYLVRSRCFSGLAIVPPLPADPEPHQFDLGLDHVDQGVLELVDPGPTERHLAVVPEAIPA